MENTQGCELQEGKVEDDPLSPISRPASVCPVESSEAAQNGFGSSDGQSMGASKDIREAGGIELSDGTNGGTVDDRDRGICVPEDGRVNAEGSLDSWILLPSEEAGAPSVACEQMVSGCLPTSGAPEKHWVVVQKVPSTELQPIESTVERPEEDAGCMAEGSAGVEDDAHTPSDLYRLSGLDLNISWDNLTFERPKVLLGEGAFGKVYKAEYLGMPVAVKRFAPNCADVTTADTLENELQILAAVGVHQNVVTCYGGCLRPPCVFIVEEQMDKSLYDLVHSCDWSPKPLPIRRILNLGQDIVAGIYHLHPQIVHRDLKPQNILLTKDGRAKVADFGLSRVKATTYLKTRDSLASTVEYMAPECINGANVTHKCDVYSLGIIFWECLTGLTPFHDFEHVVAIMYGVASRGDRPKFPDYLNCPLGLKQLIQDCWQQDPRDRPSCEELLVRLRKIQYQLFGETQG